MGRSQRSKVEIHGSLYLSPEGADWPHPWWPGGPVGGGGEPGGGSVPILASIAPTSSPLSPLQDLELLCYCDASLTYHADMWAMIDDVRYDYFSWSQQMLTLKIPKADLTVSGTRQVRVVDASGESLPLPFTVNEAVPPALFGVTPNSAYIGHPGITVQAVGNKFTSGSVAKADGAPKTTTFVSATSLQFDLPAADLAAGKTLNITVSNDGGPDSDFRPFYVTGAAPAPAPTLTSVNPATAEVGAAEFDVLFNGTDFVSGALAFVGGQALVTTFVSAVQLMAKLSGVDQTAGAKPASVRNPDLQETAALSFTFTAPAAGVVISTLTPPSVVLNALDTTVTVTGTGFVAGDVVHADGNNILATTFVDASTLTAVFPASLTGYAWSFTLEIYRADAAVSNQMPFPVTAAVEDPETTSKTTRKRR